MPTSLEQGESSNCTNVVLDLYHRLSGVLTDLYSLEYIIYERISNPPNLVQTYPPAGRATVDTDDCPVGHKVSQGRYVAEWDVPLAQLTGDHVIRWFWKSTVASAERQIDFEFVITVLGAVATTDGYCTIQDIRDEGVTTSELTDARAVQLINGWSRWFDDMTGTFFEPRDEVLDFDGDGSRMLMFKFPIITCNALYMNDDFVNAIDTDSYVVYDKKGPTQDDRRHPHIKIKYSTSPSIYTSASRAIFSIGDRNQRVDGIWGYVESDGSTPYGVVQAVKILVIVTKDFIDDGEIDQLIAGRKIEEVTDRHRIEYSDLYNRLKTWGPTGITMVDNAIKKYRAPMRIAAPRTMRRLSI